MKKYGIKVARGSLLPEVLIFNTYEEIASFAIANDFEHGYEMFEIEYFPDYLGKANVLKITGKGGKEIKLFAIADSENSYIFSEEKKIWEFSKAENFPKLYCEALWKSGFRLFYNPYKVKADFEKVKREKMQEV